MNSHSIANGKHSITNYTSNYYYTTEITIVLMEMVYYNILLQLK